MNIFLSIIIPCFNCGKLMSRCIESLQRQTCQDFEVIFVDDYSTDDTCLFLQNFIDSNSILASLINAPYNQKIASQAYLIPYAFLLLPQNRHDTNRQNLKKQHIFL